MSNPVAVLPMQIKNVAFPPPPTISLTVAHTTAYKFYINSLTMSFLLICQNDRAKEFKSTNNFNGIIMPKDMHATSRSLTCQLHAMLVTWHGLFLIKNLKTQTHSEMFFVPLRLVMSLKKEHKRRPNGYWLKHTYNSYDGKRTNTGLDTTLRTGVLQVHSGGVGRALNKLDQNLKEILDDKLLKCKTRALSCVERYFQTV